MKRLDMFKAHARAQWDEICFEVAPIFHVLALFLSSNIVQRPHTFNQSSTFYDIT